MFLTAEIFTNAVALAKFIEKLNKRGQKYEISIVKGIDNEDVVKVAYCWEEEEETFFTEAGDLL